MARTDEVVIPAQDPLTSPAEGALTPQAPAIAAHDGTDLGTILDGEIAGEAFLMDVSRGFGLLKDKIDRASPEESSPVVSAYLTNVLKPGNPKISSQDDLEARAAEVHGLMARSAFKKVHEHSVPPRAVVLKSRFVDAIKNIGTPKELTKTQYVVQWNNDKEKPFIAHNNSTLRQSSTKLLVSTCAVLNFRIFSHEFTQAYLQSKDTISRTIYVKPRTQDAAHFGFKKDELLFFFLLVYGISDADDYWGVTCTAHVEGDLSMEPMTDDPALYIKSGADSIEGMLGCYVDDTLLGGNKTFQVLTERSLEAFESKPRVWDCVEFLGVAAKTLQGFPRSFRLHQVSFVAVKQKLPLDVSYERFVSARAGLS